MKEIIEIGLGACGINLASSYYSQINEEHNLLSPEKKFSNEQVVHFYESANKTPIPRFIFADFDPLSIDKLLTNPNALLYNQDNLLSGKSTTNGLFPIGFSNGSDIFCQIQDVIRKEAERCESLQGFIINHSLSGGTGSGLTSLLLEHISCDYIACLINNTIIPTTQKNRIFGETALSYYNSILGFHKLIYSSSLSVLSDNLSLTKMSEKLINNEGSFKTLNKSISKVMSALTSGSRFTGLMPLSLPKILTNAIPFPRIHFFASSFFEDSYNKPNFIYSCKKNIFKNKDSLFAFDGYTMSIINSFILFRGSNFTSSEFEDFNKGSITTASEFINNRTIGHSNHVDKQNTKEAAYFNSGKFIGEYLNELLIIFQKQFRKKSFLHWYTSLGMDEMEFVEAESNISDQINEYSYNCNLIEEGDEE